MTLTKKSLWSGRFDSDMDESTLEFTSSLDVDVVLSLYDVVGSIAHATMLKKCKIIPAKDADQIIKGLKTIAKKINDGKFEIDDSLEDIHTNIEFQLTEMIGPAGRKLHTARSRNDQVATDFRMYVKCAIIDAVSGIDGLIDSLVKVAKANKDTIMPGFTHMQHAQPVTVAQHLLAHAFKLSRDASRFINAYERMDFCPLGSGALAGTTYPIDRKMTAKLLGFSGPTTNSMDSVSDRDFATESAFCASLTSIHLSSMAEELVLWSSQEFGFVEIDDRYVTGSSMMPQKKNPDVAELIRGKTGSINGSLTTMLMMTKALPLSYNRDLQEDKQPIIMAFNNLQICLAMMSKIVSTIKFNKKNMTEKTASGFMNATDLADYLVNKGVPFRDAHAIVGSAVKYCIKKDKKLDELKIEEFQKISSKIGKDVYNYIDVKSCVNRRKSIGGTSPSSVSEQLKVLSLDCKKKEIFVKQKSELLNDCWKKLIK